MIPRKQDRLKLLQQHLKAKSTKFYLSLLSRLLADHARYESLKSLPPLLRKRDFLGLYLAADSLSSQKYDDADEHFSANQIALLIKKFPWPIDLLDLKPRENAISSFYSSEKRCGLMNRKFACLGWDRSRDRFSQEARAARWWIRSIIGSRPNYRSIFQKADFGPGASVGVHGDATSYAAKINAARWTVTPGALHHGYAAIRQNYQMWELLLPRRGSYVCYDEELAFANYLSKIRVVGENNISFVPKTAKTNRAIAVEPLLNGLVQKGIDLELRNKLLKVGLDLADQGKNQAMACEGSLDDSEDGYVTIDMKSASDSVSIGIVKYLFPEDWERLLNRTRSHAYNLDGTVKVFKKFCSMGNGFCFPIETLIFASACYAVSKGVAPIDFRVYGDDIIIRKKHASTVIQLLKHWGFKINSDKTFLEGPFRESCGADWFGGKDVRPFTLDYSFDTIQNVFKFLNLTNRNERCKAFFANQRDYVVRYLPLEYRFFRPLSGEEDTGIDSLGDEHLSAPSCTFNHKKGKWEWLELSTRPLVDFSTLDLCKDQPWLMGVALRGSKSIGFGRYVGAPEVVLRNRAQTKVIRKGYVSTSNWLPTT